MIMYLDYILDCLQKDKDSQSDSACSNIYGSTLVRFFSVPKCVPYMQG